MRSLRCPAYDPAAPETRSPSLTWRVTAPQECAAGGIAAGSWDAGVAKPPVPLGGQAATAGVHTRPCMSATLELRWGPRQRVPGRAQVNPRNQFNGAVAVCSPVLTGNAVTMGSVAFPYDGAIPQLGGATIVQPPLPTCPNPLGFSA